MKQSPWQANSHSGSQEITRPFMEPEVSLLSSQESVSLLYSEPSPGPCVKFRNLLDYYGENLFDPRLIAKL
jgi:hypothetical protein